MPKVSLKHKNESFESLMRRFKKSVERAGTLQELRDRETFEKPSVRKKRAKAAAVKREARRRREDEINRKGV